MYELTGRGSRRDWEYADRLLTSTIVVPKTDRLMNGIVSMAESIHACDVRNRDGRTFEQVLADCTQTVIDESLVVLGMERPAKDFDHSDADSFIWDAQDGDVKFECKRMKNGFLTWYKDKAMSTFRKHADEIDYVVSGVVRDCGQYYEVDNCLLAVAPTFFEYETRGNGKYYEHRKAAREGQAIYRRLIP